MAKRLRRKGKPYLSHGSEGLVEFGERKVDDPMEPGRRYAAVVNVRESSIDHMASRGRINTSQSEAGQRFRKLWEMAAVGRQQAMDPGKEFVDGGGLVDPISDDLVKAAAELSRVLAATGPVGSKLLISIVGEGKRIEDVASEWARAGGVVTGRRAEGYTTGRMIEALDDLVRLWKLEASPRVVKEEKRSYYRNGLEVKVLDAIRVSTEGHVGPAKQITAGRFGDIVEEDLRAVDRGPLMTHAGGTR